MVAKSWSSVKWKYKRVVHVGWGIEWDSWHGVMTQPMEFGNYQMAAKNWSSVKLRDKFVVHVGCGREWDRWHGLMTQPIEFGNCQMVAKTWSRCETGRPLGNGPWPKTRNSCPLPVFRFVLCVVKLLPRSDGVAFVCARKLLLRRKRSRGLESWGFYFGGLVRDEGFCDRNSGFRVLYKLRGCIFLAHFVLLWIPRTEEERARDCSCLCYPESNYGRTLAIL
jgi:hypothetical protein